MKKTMMTLALVTLASSFASAKTFCSVNAPGTDPNNYDQILFQGEVDLSSGSALVYSYQGSLIFAGRSSDQNMSIVITKANDPKQWQAAAIGNGKLVVLLSREPNISVGCTEADVMPKK